MNTHRISRPAVVLGISVLAVLLAVPAASVFYESTAGESCARCHEIRPAYKVWHASSHRSVNCKDCHSASFLDPGFYLTNLHRVMTHWNGDAPEQIRLKYADIGPMVERCRSCHRQEFADWQAGPHSITYSEIFLDKDHNHKRLLMDDCLRCHGMHFEGGIRDLVTPINTTGPWQLKDPAMATQPVIPCLVCHTMHREGMPLGHPAVKPVKPGPGQELFRPSLALFDRRDFEHIANSVLPLPKMLDGDRPVKISPDPRQALCYQCNAPSRLRGDDADRLVRISLAGHHIRAKDHHGN